MKEAHLSANIAQKNFKRRLSKQAWTKKKNNDTHQCTHEIGHALHVDEPNGSWKMVEKMEQAQQQGW